MRRTTLALSILIALAILTTGCGGSSHSSSKTTTTTSDTKSAPKGVHLEDDLVVAVDGHLVCTGETTVVYNGQDHSDLNAMYSHYLDRTQYTDSDHLTYTSAFGYRAYGDDTSGQTFVVNLESQLKTIIATLNAGQVFYSDPTNEYSGGVDWQEAGPGTSLKVPDTCWVQDVFDRVLMGEKPKESSTTVSTIVPQ